MLGYGAIPTGDIEEGLRLLRACFNRNRSEPTLNRSRLRIGDRAGIIAPHPPPPASTLPAVCGGRRRRDLQGTAMTVHGLNHVTIRCRPRDLPALHRFYTDAIGLAPGWRPPFPFDGYWLYPPASQTAAIHIAATHPDEAALASPAPSGFDHLSLTQRRAGRVEGASAAAGHPLRPGAGAGGRDHAAFPARSDRHRDRTDIRRRIVTAAVTTTVTVALRDEICRIAEPAPAAATRSAPPATSARASTMAG